MGDACGESPIVIKDRPTTSDARAKFDYSEVSDGRESDWLLRGLPNEITSGRRTSARSRETMTFRIESAHADRRRQTAGSAKRCRFIVTHGRSSADPRSRGRGLRSPRTDIDVPRGARNVGHSPVDVLLDHVPKPNARRWRWRRRQKTSVSCVG